MRSCCIRMRSAQTPVVGVEPTIRDARVVLANPLCADPSPTCGINQAAFAMPAPGTYSTLARANIPGPAYLQVDAAISREFRIREGQTLEMRAEAFNIGNSFRAGVAPRSAHHSGHAEVRILKYDANGSEILNSKTWTYSGFSRRTAIAS